MISISFTLEAWAGVGRVPACCFAFMQYTNPTQSGKRPMGLSWDGSDLIQDPGRVDSQAYAFYSRVS